MAVPTFNIPSKSEAALQNIVKEDFQPNKTVKPQTDFFKKVDAFVASGKFATEEEAFQEAAKAAVHFWDEFEWIDLQSIITPKETIVETPEAPETQEEIGIDTLTDKALSIWKWVVTWEFAKKAWQTISETAKKFKFESDVDDKILESTLKFVWNLPANTAQIAWDVIEVAADPIWTTKSLLDLWQGISDKLVFWTLNSVFWQDVEPTEKQLIVDWIWQELKRIADTPWEVKSILVENPADVLLSVTWGLWVAKNVAKSKNLTWLANKLDKAQEILNPIKLQAEAVKWTWKALTKTKQSIFPEKSLDEIVLETTQWLEKNIPAAKEALSKIDTKWIETYRDLNNAISQKISDIAKKQDELLPTDEVLNISDLNTTKGKRTTNFVNNALDDLENVWENTSDLELLNKVDDLRDKEFVSIKDINDLARFYGSQFKNKSFDKLGNQKANISASRFENTRKGLKDISRELLPDDSVKLLDDELTKLFETQWLTEKVAENVTKLQRKIKDRWLIENVARWLWQAIDIASLWSIRWLFTSILPSNVWNKVLNSLDIEANLAKNLKKLSDLERKAENLSDAKLTEEATKTLSDIVWDNALIIEWASVLENNNE